MKLGIIGCGRITEKHIETVAKLAQVKVEAVSDLSEERMKSAKEQLEKQGCLSPVFFRCFPIIRIY